MKIVTSYTNLNEGCAFVPTMGALHAGHASLFNLARTQSQTVVASIFINPLQFDSSEDLARYPRTPDRDIEIAEAAGVTHLWLPRQADIYPGEIKKLSAGSLGDIYEGKSRPGHFDGVVTVVSRFFDLVRPKYAIFGEKDFQQLTLIKRFKADVEIITAPTIREPDGLAISSRNVGLNESNRTTALVLYRALLAAKSSGDLAQARANMQDICSLESTFKLDYAEIVDESDFSIATDTTHSKRAIIAGWLNGVRLIDNMQMSIGASV
jgi:pantoate--beta-alanine ligase|tara:strand:+ start:485 stop:1282 length:798 start_codon:yes stop_codon:yes gene_type:complete